MATLKHTPLRRGLGDTDGSFAHQINVRYKDGSFRPIDSGIEHIECFARQPNYVHASTDGYRNILSISDYELAFVGRISNDGCVTAFEEKDMAVFRLYGPHSDITHIGNTLCVLTSDGIQYFLFRDNKYVSLGTKPPTPDVSFRFESPTTGNDGSYVDYRKQKVNRIKDGVYIAEQGSVLSDQQKQTIMNAIRDNKGDQSDYAEAMIAIERMTTGPVVKAYDEIYSHGLLPDTPTFVRFGLRMFDGTHTRISPPILLNDQNGLDSVAQSIQDIGKWPHTEIGTKYISLKGRWVVIPFDKGGDKSDLVDVFKSVDGKIVATKTPSERLSNAEYAKAGIGLYAANANYNDVLLYLMAPEDLMIEYPPQYATIENPLFYRKTDGSSSYDVDFYNYNISTGFVLPTDEQNQRLSYYDSAFGKYDAGAPGPLAHIECHGYRMLCGTLSLNGGRLSSSLESNAKLSVALGFDLFNDSDYELLKDYIGEVKTVGEDEQGLAYVVRRNKLHSHFACLCKELGYIWRNSKHYSDWADIITALDIFISKPIPVIEQDKSGTFPPDGIECVHVNEYPDEENAFKRSKAKDLANGAADIKGEFEMTKLMFGNNTFGKRSKDDIWNDVASVGEFYLLHSVPFSDIKEMDKQGEWYPLTKEIAENYRTIEQRETIADDYGSNDEIIPKCCYAYNQSLTLGNISTMIFNGFPLSTFVIHNRSYNSIRPYGTIVNLSGASDSAKRITYLASPVNGYLSPMFFFPSHKATSATMLTRCTADGHDNGTLVRTDIPMSEHKTLNGSFYLTENITPIECVPVWDSIGGVDPVLINLYCNINDAEEFGVAEDSNPIKDEPNKVMATKISNPWVFEPTKTTYAGTTGIIALRAITAPISQGQAGQHPMYVFTSDGIYSFSIAQDGKFLTAHPLSFDVLLSKNLLCSTDSAIFFGCKQGIKVLHGGSTKLISQPIDYTLAYAMPQSISATLKKAFGCPDDGPTSSHSAYDRYMLPLHHFLSNADNAVLAYEYSENEILLCDTIGANTFAYVYHIPSGSWYSRTLNGADHLLSCYPSLFAVSGNRITDLSQKSGIKLGFLCYTNPFGSSDFVKIESVLVRTDAVIDAGSNITSTLFASPTPFIARQVSRTSTAQPGDLGEYFCSGLHHGRIPASVRYIALGIVGHASDMALSTTDIIAKKTDTSHR